MTNAEFDTYYRLYAGQIRAVALTILKHVVDDDLVEDLYQEGLMALWQLDLTKTHSNEKARIRQAARARMIDFLRQQKSDLYESLNAHLTAGAQVAADPSTGFGVMIEEGRRRPIHLISDEETNYDRSPEK